MSALSGLICALSVAATGPGPLVTGDRLAGFQMLDTAGRTVSWAPGRITVFSICAFWCDTWKTQIPRLVKARSALAGLPVDIRTISTDGRWAEVARNNGGLPLWRDPGGAWSRQVGVNRVPTTVVVDAEGRVVFADGEVIRSNDIVRAARQALAHANPADGPVYLTFDDFPPANGGEALLDALREQGVRATLFCIGSRMEPNADLLRRAEREGHSVQCHSWSHDAADPQLDRCRRVFVRVLGTSFRLYRAPGSERIAGLALAPHVVDPYDYTRPGSEEVLRRVLSAVRPGCEIQLHAGVFDTLSALPEIVGRLRERGFTFETL